jgi:hypothetical protein
MPRSVEGDDPNQHCLQGKYAQSKQTNYTAIIINVINYQTPLPSRKR